MNTIQQLAKHRLCTSTTCPSEKTSDYRTRLHSQSRSKEIPSMTSFHRQNFKRDLTSISSCWRRPRVRSAPEDPEMPLNQNLLARDPAEQQHASVQTSPLEAHNHTGRGHELFHIYNLSRYRDWKSCRTALLGDEAWGPRPKARQGKPLPAGFL